MGARSFLECRSLINLAIFLLRHVDSCITFLLSRHVLIIRHASQAYNNPVNHFCALDHLYSDPSQQRKHIRQAHCLLTMSDEDATKAVGEVDSVPRKIPQGRHETLTNSDAPGARRGLSTTHP